MLSFLYIEDNQHNIKGTFTKKYLRLFICECFGLCVQWWVSWRFSYTDGARVYGPKNRTVVTNYNSLTCKCMLSTVGPVPIDSLEESMESESARTGNVGYREINGF